MGRITKLKNKRYNVMRKFFLLGLFVLFCWWYTCLRPTSQISCLGPDDFLQVIVETPEPRCFRITVVLFGGSGDITDYFYWNTGGKSIIPELDERGH